MFQTYGIDISRLDFDELERKYGVDLVATLAVQLPWPSRIHIAADPRARWGIDGLLLARIDFMLNSFSYALSEDAKTGINKPRLLIPETEDMKRDRLKMHVNGADYVKAQLDYDTYMEIIRKNREGATQENGG